MLCLVLDAITTSKEIMSGLSAAEKSKMASFMGSVNTKARNMLEVGAHVVE